MRFLVASVALTASACVFDLPQLAEGTGGGGGAGGSVTSTGGATTTTSSTGGAGAAVTTYQLTVSYPAGAVTEEIPDVPVPVFLDPSRMDYSRAESDGSDVRAFDDSDEPLPMEIESWDPGGTSILWVRLPSIVTAGGAFTLRFGDPSAPAGPPAADVWAGYTAVYHFADEVPDTEVVDSLGTSPGVGTATTREVGQIGFGVALDGTTSEIALSNDTTWEVPAGEVRTMSIWLKRQVVPGEMPMRTMIPMSNRQPGPSCRGWWMMVFGDAFANTSLRANTDDCNGTYFTTSNGGLGGYENTDWHRMLAVFDRVQGELRIYSDGQQRKVAAVSGMVMGDMVGGQARFGRGPSSDVNRLEGRLDEARVRIGAPSPAWIETTFRLERNEILGYGPVTER